MKKKKSTIILISMLLLLVMCFPLSVSAKTVKTKSYSANKVTAKQIVVELKKTFKIKKISTPAKSETIIGQPNAYKTKTDFYDPKYPRMYCTVEVFEDTYDAAQRFSFIQSLGQLYDLFGLVKENPTQVCRYKNVVIRFNDDVPTKRIARYYKVLKKIVK